MNEISNNDTEDVKVVKKEKLNVFAKGFLAGIGLCLLLLCIIFAGRNFYDYLVLNGVIVKENKDDTIINNHSLQKIDALEAMIDEYYYEEDIPIGDLQNGIYRGIVNALGDPYSEYYTKEEYDATMRKTSGISYGIGAYISIDLDTEFPVISGVMEDSPAKEAGVMEGDIIYMVNDEPVQGYALSEVVAKIKGKENTSVHITLYREGQPEYLEFDIKRKKMIEAETVRSEMLEDGIGYITISEFDTVTLDQFTEAMAVLAESGMQGLILDLRSNPGGNLITVTEIARKILPEGLIVYTEDKNGERVEYSCDGKKELQIPMVVLINEYSASASEILAGAIKSYSKGTLIGMTTYGKGIVQRILTMSDGTAVKLTVSTYFTPDGQNIHGVGIEPDIEIKFDSEAYYEEGYDNQLEKGMEVLREKLH